MDLTESALVTYALNLKMNEREITELVDDVEQRLASERIVNPLLAEEVEYTLEEDQRERERELEERRAKAEERKSNLREKGAHWWWGLANLTVGMVETTFGVIDMVEKSGLSGYGLPSIFMPILSSVGILYGGLMMNYSSKNDNNEMGSWYFNSLGTVVVIAAPIGWYAFGPPGW